MKSVLAAESIGKSFGRRRVLASAGLWARPSTVTLLVGRNGSGKSTLLRIAAGRLRPDYGVVLFGGERYARPRLYRLAAAGLFYLPDRGLLSSAFPLARHLAAVAELVPEAGVSEATDLLAVEPLLDRRPGELSGGERRRAEVAVAVARRPRCLLADEPYLGIMPRDAALLDRGFRTLAARGCAVVITGQEATHLLEIADEVLWQTDGTTEYLGTAAEALAHHRFRREYLGR